MNFEVDSWFPLPSGLPYSYDMYVVLLYYGILLSIVV